MTTHTRDLKIYRNIESDTLSIWNHVNEIGPWKNLITEMLQDIPTNASDVKKVAQKDELSLKDRFSQLPSILEVVKQTVTQVDGKDLSLSDRFERFRVNLQIVFVENGMVKLIERNTREQASSTLWQRLHMFTITGSKAHSFKTAAETLQRKIMNDPNTPKTVSGSLWSRFSQLTDLSAVPAVQYGKQQESTAKANFKRFLELEHTNVEIRDVGLTISSDYPYMGASPDGYVSCDCCEPRLLEIKCPFLAKDASITNKVVRLPYLNNELKLKTNSAYYTQITMQMAVHNIHRIYFVTYSPKDATSPLWEEVSFHENTWDNIRTKLIWYYSEVLFPKMELYAAY